MPVSLPVAVNVPAHAVVFAESVHARNFRMSERTDRFHKVLYVERGRVELHATVGGSGMAERRSVGEAGAVFVIPAGTRHRISDLAPSVLLLICAGGRWMGRTAGSRELWANLVDRAAGGITFERDLETAREWERLWRRALLEQGRTRPGADVLREALAWQLLTMLARQSSTRLDDSSEARVRRVTQELDEGFFERWTLDGAAARAGLSRRHFTQCFRQLHGTTLVNYLNARRVDHAERLLASGRHTVTGAVFSSGFEDLANFYRLFKRRHGRAPGAWMAGERPPAICATGRI